MAQGSNLKDMALPTPRSACWDYFRVAEKGFRELFAELQELAALVRCFYGMFTSGHNRRYIRYVHVTRHKERAV